jgi:alpha-galactosidase
MTNQTMMIKKSTLLACLRTTLSDIEIMRDVHHPMTSDQQGPYDYAECNWQAMNIDEQEDEIRQAIKECEKLDDSEFILLDANQLRDALV